MTSITSASVPVYRDFSINVIACVLCHDHTVCSCGQHPTWCAVADVLQDHLRPVLIQLCGV